MNLINLMHKAFFGGDWYVGYRKKNSKEDYTIIPGFSKKWIADPFLFEYENEHYLFVEYVEDKKGVIAYFKYIDEIPVFQKVIIAEPYHLSYPCIFEYNGKVYMIPESADNNSIDLYLSESFPENWKKITTLTNGRYLDSTILKWDNYVYLFSYISRKGFYELCCFKLDMETMSLEKISSKEFDSNVGRPAGSFIYKSDKLLRPSQDCSKMYGEKIIWNEVVRFDQTEIVENIESVVHVKTINPKFERIHTYNVDSKYEVVDFFKEHFDLFRPIKLIRKKLNQK